MRKTKAFAVVCVLFVLVSGSVAFVPADGSRERVDGSSQVAASTGPAETIAVAPESSRGLRNQPMTFAVRVVADPRDGILLGFQVDSETPMSFEFHNPSVEVLSVPLLYPSYDVVAYIPAAESDAEEYVPVTMSPDEKLPIERSTVEVTRISQNPDEMSADEFTFGVRCPVECRGELMLQWVIGSPEIILTFLGLLIAFFGRKRIWNALYRLRPDEDGIEENQRPNGETGTNPPETDAVGDSQRPEN